MRNYIAALLLTFGVFGLLPCAYADADSSFVQELFLKARGGDEDALISIRQKAAEGDAAAQFRLGVLYDLGQGVKRDYAQAFMWYRKTAEKGNSDGQFNLGNLYQNGQGVTQDYAQAVTWYRKSADQGFSFAQMDLGRLYEKGQGVTQDYAQAVTWFRKARP